MAIEDRSALNGLEKRLFKLVSRKATSAQWAEWLRAPLEHALAAGDKDLAMTLLKAGANGGAGWKGCDGRTLLDAAAEGGSEGIVSTLLDAGARADLDAVSGEKRMTALHRACENGHTAEAQALLVEGADVGLVDSDGRSALHYALEGGHEELASRLIAAGGNIKARNNLGDTPIHLAAALGWKTFVGMLVRRGVSVDVANNDRHRPLHLAVKEGHTAVVEILLKAGANPNRRYGGSGIDKQCSPLFLARKNVAITKMLLKHGADVTRVDGIGYTALHWAAASGSPEVIDALLGGGADLEKRSGKVYCGGGKYVFKGLAPLHLAAKSYNLGNMTALLEEGACINAKDDAGKTPLHVVCEVSSERPSLYRTTADFLLRRGADETLTDNNGNTPEDLIESSVATRSLQQLLATAPADRTWRRRGMLVVCRAHSAKAFGGVGDGKRRRAGKIPRQGKGGGGGGASRIEIGGCLLTRVVGLEADAVFRTIVGFL